MSFSKAAVAQQIRNEGKTPWCDTPEYRTRMIKHNVILVSVIVIVNCVMWFYSTMPG